MNFKYISTAQISFSIMALGIPVIILLIIISDMIIWICTLLLWLILVGLYGAFISESGIYTLNEKEFRELSEFLEKKEVGNYIKELISKKPVEDITRIAIEIDLKFNTNLTQKKGWYFGKFNDERLYRKLLRLDNKVRFGKKILPD